MMSFPTPLPPLFPRLTHRIHKEDSDIDHTCSVLLSISPTHNQNQRNRVNSEDVKFMTALDREEFTLHANNLRIAVHGQSYLRPPGLEPYEHQVLYSEQDQQGTLAQVDGTFLEDEEGFILSEDDEAEDYEDEELLEDEEHDLDADIEQPSDASYLTVSPNTTPTRTQNQGDVFPIASSPTTPSAMPSRTHEIEALSGLADTTTRLMDGFAFETSMDLEETDEGQGEDLDADIEDMDDESFESTFFEGDSMGL